MASFSREFSTASPVLAMPPQSSHQTLPGMSSMVNPPASFAPMPSKAAFAPPPVQSFAAAISRKRSRDEAAINLEPDTPPEPEPVESQDDWVYGEGMVLIKPNKAGYVADAGSQSGTWMEEKKAAEEEERRKAQEEFALLRNPKSQRMEQTTADMGSSATTASSAGNSPGQVTACSSVNNTSGPVVDDFTLHLGIGWRRISDDEDIQAAARGWARFIDNHYPLNDARVVLESKGLQSYLVEAAEGFFLVAEDLRQARLVSSTVNGALQNLQCTPPKFDSDDTLVAAETPRPSESQTETVLTTDTEMGMD